MVTRFNFGTEQSFVPSGYILDFGEAYSEERGYGWVEESDFTTPIDLTPNGRNRDLTNFQLIDTFMHMDYPSGNPNPRPIDVPAAWQYDVPNGRYRVTVGVGDGSFFDSLHAINVEGVSTISNFDPSPTNPFSTAISIAEVEDNQLTIDSIGGNNTKINYIEIAPITNANINFGLRSSPAPDGYISDFGQPYSGRRGYGWITQDSVNSSESTSLDLTTNVRDRNSSSDDLSDSFVHMQYPPNSEVPIVIDAPGAWEYALPDGVYRVTARVGDAEYTDSTHVINAEGVNVIDSFDPTSDNKFRTATRVIEVDDGRLTIDAIGGDNTKLNSLRITSVTDTRINFGPEDITGIPEDYLNDYGRAYSEDRGYGWITQDSVDSENPTRLDLTGNARSRDVVDDPISGSFLHLQYPEDGQSSVAERTPAAWEYALPNGEYEVTVGVGDPLFTDSSHAVNIEGVEAIADFVPSSGALFTTATEIVEVTDGRLTIDAIGGENTKLNFIEIAAVDSDMMG